MQDMLGINARAMRFWFDLALAQQQAALTIALRLPLIAAESGAPLEATSESVRMVSEKAAAATLGSVAVGRALFRGRRGRGPAAAAAQTLALCEAFTKPAMRKVAANSRRLSKAKSKQK
jgi:hypothetical protein